MIRQMRAELVRSQTLWFSCRMSDGKDDSAGSSEEPDTDALLDATTALIPPLLTALDALTYVGRHLHPPNLADLVTQVGQFQEPVAEGLEAFEAVAWPAHLERFRDHAVRSAKEALQAFEGLDRCLTQSNPAMGAYRAMSFNTRAVEALYPVSFMLPPVSRFFLGDNHRGDDALQQRLAGADPSREEVGIMHAGNQPTERGGFSLYVPEYYDASRALPLVVALHGGSGHGRSFLWTWLKDARSRDVIVASPSSTDATWSLMGPDRDSANLDAIVDHVREHWRVDEARILLTGMSDGGTFSYLSGLRDDTAFTHLAPISASFHPMLLEVASKERIEGLPIYLTHGVLDWMFDVGVARMARDALTAAGVDLTYRELDDLSHTYPREENDRILDWLLS
jgi:phospholipase/carboxylesterase